ncbi:MAG: hypothetical protein KatS3mg105_3347 [Gemmatales bacterium]|nr:MAG: hypothetical protein KatS3mg105_3347 [Gemmatales bacterium]
MFRKHLLILLLPAVGCASVSRKVDTIRWQCDPRDVVFAVNGAGGFHGLSDTLQSEISRQHVPLAVATFDWTHGYGRVVADQIDHAHIRCQGVRLAESIVTRKQNFPQSRILIVAHSAGCAVALAAAESVPLGYIDRMVLLAPAVSTGYDLRPSLRASKKGIDVFTSERDGYLVLGSVFLGTVDRCRMCPVAGRRGFEPIVQSAEDSILYAKLRQYAWGRWAIPAGHYGGHFGAYHPRHLRAYVLPLLIRP